MGRLIDEEDAINAILREYNADDSDYPTEYQQGLHAAKSIIEQLPPAQSDLITQMQNGIKATDADDAYSCGMRNGMRWCISLIDDKEPLYENCPSAQTEPLTDKEQRIFLAAMTREELICLQIDEKHNDPNLINLVEICHEIIRKVKGALWT